MAYYNNNFDECRCLKLNNKPKKLYKYISLTVKPDDEVGKIVANISTGELLGRNRDHLNDIFD